MIFGAKEEIIPKYYDDDKPKSVQKTAFGLAQIILLWLGEKKPSSQEDGGNSTFIYPFKLCRRKIVGLFEGAVEMARIAVPKHQGNVQD